MPNTEMRIVGPSDAPTLVLAHGAGAGMDTPFFEEFCAGLSELNVRTVRFEFPYMQRRRAEGSRRAPDRPAVLEASWNQVIEGLGSRLVIGGKSMGGRIASMVADRNGVSGLVCLGYPFHPPGRPEKLRTAHLTDLRTPTLILQGTRDPFGRPEEIATYDLSSSIRVQWIEDGDHSFKPRKKSGRTLEQNLDQAVESTASFVHRLFD